MRYDVCLFDFDGTLVDSNAAVLLCMEMTLVHFHGSDHRASRGDILREISQGTTLRDAFMKLSICASSDRADPNSMTEYYRSLYRSVAPDLTKCFADVPDILAGLSDTGIRCVVLSNKGEDAVRSILSHVQLERYFDYVIAERSDIPRKPNPAAFTDIICRHYSNIQRSRFLMIGDTLADIEFARNSGIDICWAEYGYGDREKCRELMPTHVIRQFSELRQLLGIQ